MVRRPLYLIASVGKLLPLLVDEGPAEVGDVGKMLEALLENKSWLYNRALVQVGGLAAILADT